MQEFTNSEIHTLVDTLKPFYDFVRVVSVEHFSDIDHGTVQCYSLWGRNTPCSNCISRHAVADSKRMVKFDFIGNDVYYVVATPLKVDGESASLEMLIRLEDDLLLNSDGYNEFIDKISKYNNAVTKDGMTGLYNKQYFQNYLSSMILAPSDAQMGILMCDVDDFKEINDSFGHIMGDHIIMAIAQVLLGCTENCSDKFAARFGGDEFVVLLKNTTEDEMKGMIRTIKENVKRIDRQYQDVSVSMSIGYACQQQGYQRSALVEEADKALYVEKEKYHIGR